MEVYSAFQAKPRIQRAIARVARQALSKCKTAILGYDVPPQRHENFPIGLQRHGTRDTKQVCQASVAARGIQRPIAVVAHDKAAASIFISEDNDLSIGLNGYFLKEVAREQTCGDLTINAESQIQPAIRVVAGQNTMGNIAFLGPPGCNDLSI